MVPFIVPDSVEDPIVMMILEKDLFAGTDVKGTKRGVGQANSDLAIALHSTEVKGKSIGAYLVEILTGEEINKN